MIVNHGCDQIEEARCRTKDSAHPARTLPMPSGHLVIDESRSR